LRCLVGNCVNVSEALLPISAHLILQPVALLLRPALSKSILLIASNSRQLTNSTSAFGCDGILSEYEFRSRHSASHTSSSTVRAIKSTQLQTP
jgi:hypothetical protein